MLVELSKKSQLGFIYILNSEKICNTEYNIVKTEQINGVVIQHIRHTKDIVIDRKKINLNDLLENLVCKCTKKFNIEQINQLPEEGWEDLIDFWSCHDSEFKTMLNLKTKPRKNGILTGNFYFLINENESCCLNKQKIFYNEVFDEKTCKRIAYNFFVNYFKHHSKYHLNHKNNVYELCLFDKVYVYNNRKAEPALKLGIKQIEKVYDPSQNINDYFCQIIHNDLTKNKLEVVVFEYFVTFFIA